MDIESWSFKRLMKDIRDIIKNPLHEDGIYYMHDDENILKGYALIRGPLDTPYSYGFYLFEITYPKDYPTNPPKFTFLTNSDNVRMNPNLYRNGKVCVSILNTWRGEQWSSCQTIKTVLLTLLMIFNNKPLLNEPGFQEDSEDFEPYNEIIMFKNIDTAIIKVLKEEIYPDIFKKFSKYIIESFLKNYNDILATIKLKKGKSSIISTRVYSMNVDVNYRELETKIIALYKKLK